MKHRVTLWNLDGSARPWGWKCETCREEAGGFATLDDADEAAAKHERENA